LSFFFPLSIVIALGAFGTIAFSFFRDRGAPGHLSFSFGILLLAIQCLAAGMISHTRTEAVASAWCHWSQLAQAFLPSVWLFFSLKFSRGNHEVYLRKWLFALAVAVLVPLGSVFFLQDSLFGAVRAVASGWEFEIGLGGFLLYTVVLLFCALALMNLERTVRAAVGTMRWRIKFVIIAVAILLTAKLYTSAQVLLTSQHSVYLDLVNAAALLIASPLLIVGTLRAGSFQVKVYPSERVLQFSVAGILVGGYLIVIGLASKFFARSTVPELQGLQALILLLSIAGIALLLLSERARDRFKRFISRNFRRPFYDYRAAWLSFTDKAASTFDPQSFSQSVVSYISETLHVLSVSLWLFDDEASNIRLAYSTGFPNADNPHTESLLPHLPALVQHLSAHPYPFDVDRTDEPWAPALAHLFADQFTEAGNRVCVPLLARNRLLGLITLGDRVHAIPLATEEFELLKCIGDQVASTLLNIQLSNRLVQAKEMEAFQTIAAFFVHDLKNTASTLNLTLQNLPRHWENEQFRSDALRAISKSVGHIHDLIGRLTLFRQKLELHPQPTDLNKLLQSCIASFPPDLPVDTEFSALPPIRADATQLEKVFTNLILNAREALRDHGAIHVQTRAENGWTVITVSDNGCGMTPEFVNRCLFRPFQTTKKGGIGIGMFQTKAIVDAHRGRIEVDSQLGRGTTFRILLPAS
jgi:putative PEP-CTERM system histidine kinase